jgi:rod shape-determining protein MreD
MSSLVMICGAVAAGILQGCLPGWAWLGQVRPPLLLGVALYYALNHDRRLMVQAAILAGLMQDALGPVPLGYSAFGFVLTGAAVQRFRDELFIQQALTHLVLGAAAAAANTLLLAALLLGSGLIEVGPVGLALKILGAAAWALAAVPAACAGLRALDRLVGNIPAHAS